MPNLPPWEVIHADLMNLALIDDAAMKVDTMLQLADSVANLRLRNASNDAELAEAYLQYTKDELENAKLALIEAEANYAEYEGHDFSSQKVSARRNKEIAAQQVQQRQVKYEYAVSSLEQAQREEDNLVAIIETLHRIEGHGLTFDELVYQHESLFIQLQIKVPGQEKPPSPPEEEYYYYYEDGDEADSTTTVVGELVASPLPPSPTPSPADIAEIKGEIIEIAEREMEEFEKTLWEHPAFIAGGALFLTACCCLCVYRTCCRSTRAVVNDETDQMQGADEHYEDDEYYEDDDNYEDIELEERNGRGRTSRERERSGLNYAPRSNDDDFGCRTSTRAHKSNSKHGGSQRKGQRIP